MRLALGGKGNKSVSITSLRAVIVLVRVKVKVIMLNLPPTTRNPAIDTTTYYTYYYLLYARATAARGSITVNYYKKSCRRYYYLLYARATAASKSITISYWSITINYYKKSCCKYYYLLHARATTANTTTNYIRVLLLPSITYYPAGELDLAKETAGCPLNYNRGASAQSYKA
ncbi:hypothetical protein K504DRAFT_447148 [Pleomassaria siparia CBS 279.74]|uniref:Uncharacterized protein n=1 Tax=Pleomassaria siparia CBS 279.74 TaxID=1314801 RepID=A0A6G1K3U6_9PLEO|nr:hypothetical protein K504DRAFT_447148 [Pleomassaria siparia CBS 279.74]